MNSKMQFFVFSQINRYSFLVKFSDSNTKKHNHRLLHSFVILFKDMQGALTAAEVSNALGLSALKTRTWSIFKTSATKGEGLEEAMDW